MYRPVPPRSTCRRWSARCSTCGRSATCSRARSSRPATASPGCSTRARPPPTDARHPPRRGARLQGRLPAVPDHEGQVRPAQGRLGLPRPARRAGGRARDRLARQAGHRGVRDRRVQRAVPRVRGASRRRVRGDDGADGLLGGPLPGLLDDGLRLRPERVVVAAAGAPQGAAGPATTGWRRTAPGAARPCPTTSSRRATRPSWTRRCTCGCRSPAARSRTSVRPCWSGRRPRGRWCRTPRWRSTRTSRTSPRAPRTARSSSSPSRSCTTSSARTWRSSSATAGGTWS